MQSRLRLTDEFAGGPPKNDDARVFLRARGLEYDEELASLVWWPCEKAPNPLSSRQISLSLTRDSTENLQIAAKFTTLKVVTVNTDFERQVEEQLEVTVTASVTLLTAPRRRAPPPGASSARGSSDELSERLTQCTQQSSHDHGRRRSRSHGTFGG